MTFTGKAIYDSGVFANEVAEDVSDLIGLISPYETEFLNMLSAPSVPAKNVLHEWLEEKLGPNSVVASTAVGSTTAASSVTVHDGSGNAISGALQVGMVLVMPSGEYCQITGISGDDVTFSRAQASTTATSYAAGFTIEVLADAALEGADVSGDLSMPRTRKTNYCQIFKKDVIVSGTVQSVQKLGGISNEYDHQRGQRLKEILRDLEKAVLRGKSFGNTLGSASAYRTFNGVLAQVTTNVTSVGSLTQTALDAAIKAAWNQGGFQSGRGVILADANWKLQVDSYNNSRIQVVQRDPLYSQNVMVYENAFGVFEVHLNRWMPANSAVVLSPDKIKVLPLDGRSFAYVPVARTGDAEKGMLIGEYTVEVKNEAGMAKLHGGVI